MQRKRLVAIMILGIIVLLAGSLAGCQAVTTTPPPAGYTICSTLVEKAESYGATSYFVQRQVIVTGPPEAIDEIVGGLDGKLKPLADCDLSYLGRGKNLPAEGSESPPFEPSSRTADFPRIGDNATRLLGLVARRQPLAMRLYQIDGDGAVEEIVTWINQKGADRNVYADPNYLTGHLAKSACGTPNGPKGNDPDTEGSPFGMEGSPFGMEGSNGSGIGLNAPADAFQDQWAFMVIGAGAYKDASTKQTGRNVDVGVFDTSPFKTAGAETIDAIKPPLVLDVVHPPQVTILTSSVTQTLPVQDHGLFVAGLVHGISISSTIHLIRVLDEHGCGDVYTLTAALHEFMARMQNENPERGLVINLSLGVRQPRNARAHRVPAEISALETAVRSAYNAGAVIVAAAGNDSVDHVKRLPMELPAEYAFVMGVAASTIKNQPACFSNAGDVVAPGGEAKLDTAATPAKCQGVTDLCPDGGQPKDCPYGVISLARQSRTDYAYWTGTSFATPMVSGLAALAYEGKPRSVNSAIDVYRIVRSGVTPVTIVDPGDAQFGNGIINVTKSLNP